MTITDEDRERFPNHTDSSILGIKLIERLSDDDLLAISEGHAMKFQGLRVLIGSETNTRWIKARVAEQLYDRDLIDESKLDQLMRICE